MPKAKRTRARQNEHSIRIHFLGATRAVTGSLHFFEITSGDKLVRFFLDAGLDQQDESNNHQNRLPSGLKPSDLNFGILSHAHIDHSGFIPKLVKDGFAGKVYATAATCDLLGLLLPDSGFLQEEQANRSTKRQQRRCDEAAKTKRKVKGCCDDGKAVKREPLYTEDEAKTALNCLQPVEFDTLVKICDQVAVKFTPASHILGAAVVSLELGEGGKKRRLVFSGDLGRPGMPIIKDLVSVKQADYLICEGTYGNRLHVKRDRLEALAEIIHSAHKRAAQGKNGCGAIIIPAFAVGRVQSVLVDLVQLMAEKRIPQLPVFVDSPMAIRANEIYRRYTKLYNAKAAKLAQGSKNLFATPRYQELLSWQDSVKLDEPAKEPFIVVGSSGMATGGRIIRHLEKRLPGKQNTVVFIGYQGDGTVGRQLVTPETKEVNIGGKSVAVKATIEHLVDYSGHADYQDIIRWVSAFERKPTRVFLVHGEEEALLSLQEQLQRRLRLKVEVPRHRDLVELE